MMILISAVISVTFASVILPTFSEVSYEILDNGFYNQPVVCIYEPNVPDARQVILDA